MVVAILGVGVFSLVILAVLTLVYCFCDQLTACGRSYHTLAGLWQGTSCEFIYLSNHCINGLVCSSFSYLMLLYYQRAVFVLIFYLPPLALCCHDKPIFMYMHLQIFRLLIKRQVVL